MKPTIKVSISGIAFTLDDDAYEQLKAYLDKLNAYFRGKEGGKEVVDDIESRMAELLLGNMSSPNQSVNRATVEEVIGIMGKPEELSDEGATVSGETYSTSIPSSAKKRLYRNPDNQIIAGVCGGLGAYFNIDPLVFRLLFGVLSFSGILIHVPFFGVSGGIFLLLYILLWICLPQALTMSQKLEMRGESPSVTNIERRMREEAQRSPITTASNSSSSLGKFIKAIAKVFLIFFGIVFAIPMLAVGFSLLVALFAVVFSGGWFINEGLFSLTNVVALPGINTTFVKILLIVILLLPLLMLVYGVVQLIFRFKVRNKSIFAATTIVWLLSILTLVGIGGYSLRSYRSFAKNVTQETLYVSSDTLYVNIPKEFEQSYERVDLLWSNHRNHNIIPLLWVSSNSTSDVALYPSIELRYRDDIQNVELKVISTARGKSRSDAQHKLPAMSQPYTLQDSLLTIVPSHYSKESKWSGELNRLVLYVPSSKTVILDNELQYDMYKTFDNDSYFDDDWDGWD